MEAHLSPNWKLADKEQYFSYGQIMLINSQTGEAFRPYDIVRADSSHDSAPAAEVVRTLAKTANLDDDAKCLVELFLSQRTRSRPMDESGPSDAARARLPKFLIGDSADDRAFIVHLHRPRFLAEVAEPAGGEIRVLDWYDDPPADEMLLARVLREAKDFWLPGSKRESPGIATNNYGLSDRALRALNEIFATGDFGGERPNYVLDEVLVVLHLLDVLTEDEAALQEELEDMPDPTREFLSRVIAAARRKD